MIDPSSPIEHLFVYGTLRAQGSNAWRMKEAEFVAIGRAHGRLYRVDWYPAAQFDPSAPTMILGELYRASDELLKRLDIFEGAEYERVPVEVVTAKGIQLAYAWSFLPSVRDLKFLAHGDWLKEIESAG